MGLEVELASGITLTTGDSGNDTVSGVISGAGAFKENYRYFNSSGINSYTKNNYSAGTPKLTGTLLDSTDV